MVDARSRSCAGVEPMIVMRDVCLLHGDAALDVTEGVARSILDGTLGPEGAS